MGDDEAAEVIRRAKRGGGYDSRTRQSELSWAAGTLAAYSISNAPKITQNGP